VAGLAALVTIALLAIPASSDLRYSAALAIVALAGAASVGLLLSTLLSVRITTPSAMPWGVWFSHDPSQGPASWFAAQPGPAPTVPQATPRARVLSLVGTLVAGTVAIGALIAWSQTYAKVYVVNAEGARGALVVRIDGAEVGRVKTKPALADVVYQQFEVRTNASHRIVVTDAAGLDRTFEVDPKKTRSGWVVAPYAYERGVCIATQTSYYGKEPSDNDDAVLNATSDLIALPRSFDYVFTAPPSVLQTTHASSQTRTALRALNCNEVERRPYPPRGNKRRNPDLL